MTSGPDFSSYSLSELYESRNGIDREQYPERFAHILQLIEEKEAAIQADSPTVEAEALVALERSVFWGDADEQPEPVEAPSMMVFSLYFLGVLLVFAVMLGLLMENFGIRSNAGLSVLIYAAGAAFVSWLFSGRYERGFSKSEFLRICAFCWLWAVLFEVFGIATRVMFPQHFDPGSEQVFNLEQLLPLLIGASLVLNALFIWLAFRFPGQRAIRARLEKVQDD